MELITVLVTVGTDWPLTIRLVMVIHSFNFRFSLVLVHLDIDECGEHVSGCNQHCVNTVGSYYCSCYTGFQINADQHTCFGRYTSKPVMKILMIVFCKFVHFLRTYLYCIYCNYN